jgi:gluconolactonase
MNSKAIFITAAGCIGGMVAMVSLGQAPAPAAPQSGPGVQAPADSKYQEWVMSKCKMPPAPRGGGRGAAPAGGAGAAARGGAAPAANPNEPPPHRAYEVKEIPGVIAAGQKWKSVWTGTGNNADGMIAYKDGVLAAQNTNSDAMLIDKDGKVSFPFKDTNTGGALSMNKKGAIFAVSRGLPQAVLQLAPQRRIFTNMYNGEPLDCIGGVINDLTADSKGGVYFTMGGLFYVDPKGTVTKQGMVAGTNGLVLSPDEKTLYVTGRVGPAPAPGQGGGSLMAYDVKPDGSLTNERQFAMVGGDGTIVDGAGRIYTTTNGADGLAVLSPEGKLLGMIPTPLNFITVAFSGKDKKTLYGVANNQRFDEIFTIDMIAQGYKGRAK